MLSQEISKNCAPGASPLPPPRYPRVTSQSFYLPMRDGVRLAVDVHLPAPLPEDQRVPAILVQDRYWRAMALRAPLKWLVQAEDLNFDYRNYRPFIVRQGFALVHIDVRGTGASFGSWPYPWHPETLQDSYEVVEWIVSQPWSNGCVGGCGISYMGTAAELLAACGHPAVKAVVPMFNHPDAYTDAAFPGGIYNERFITAWGMMDENLDRNIVPEVFGRLARVVLAGVKPVEGAVDLLEDALQDHAANSSAQRLVSLLTYKDEQFPGRSDSLENLIVGPYLPAIRDSGVAICGFGSWLDAGTADAVIRRFLTLENARLGVIGAWDHGGQRNASPYRSAQKPPNPSLKKQWTQFLHFFNRYLKPENSADFSEDEKNLLYYTMGEERWKVSTTWPPMGMEIQRWYLREDSVLSPQSPPQETGQDEFVADFQAGSGRYNRWWELSPAEKKTVRYPQRHEASRHMLFFLTPALAEDLEISGYPVVRLFIASTESDGAFFVYLEDVDERGRVFYITEGQLRALHRKVSPNPGPYALQVPYHSFRQEDGLPLIPGQIAELHFGLLPTSVLLRKGHRLRLGIALHDRDNFRRIPESGEPTITVFRNNSYPSFIEFPAAFRA